MRTRRGVSITEVLIAAMILAFAMVPILGSLKGSVKQMEQEKLSAAAAGYVARQLNVWLYQRSFADLDRVLNDQAGVEMDQWDPGQDNDWTNFEMRLEVIPVRSLVFQYKEYRFHSGAHAAPNGLEPGPAEANGGTLQANKAPESLDRRYNNTNRPALVTLRFTIRWWRGADPTDEATRRARGLPPIPKVVLVSRRARLE